MRAFLVALILVGLGAAAFFYVQQHTPAVETHAAAPAPLGPGSCPTLRAHYQFAGDTRFSLRFERIPSHDQIEMTEMWGHRVGNLKFIVHVSTTGLDVPLTPVNDHPPSGPAYVTSAVYLTTPQGARIQTHVFDTDMHYQRELPRDDTPAPALIYMPDLMPTLIRDHVDMPPDMFRFVSCDRAAATPATTATP